MLKKVTNFGRVCAMLLLNIRILNTRHCNLQELLIINYLQPLPVGEISASLVCPNHLAVRLVYVDTY